MKNSIEPKPCRACKGTAVYDMVWNGTTHTDGPCPRCKATGTQAMPDVGAIIDLITKPNKTGGRAFRKSKPDLNEFKDTLHGQAYYVWRMIRFHGGADVTMPVMASLAVRHDSWMDVLDAIADELASRFYGTNLAAAYRWTNALGGSVKVPENMPASAYPCGPVADIHKPELEQAELI